MATMEKIAGSKIKLTVEVSADQLEEATQKAYHKTAGRYNVPGFRKGKAPRKVIENMYGPLVFFDDAFDILYPDAYEAALAEHGIEPVGRADVSIVDLGSREEAKPLIFAAEVPVYPEVKLGAYKGIEITEPEYTVTDEMVDEKIDQEREKVARFVDQDRPVQSGDDVNLDYSGSVDGVKFDGGTAEGQHLVIGSGMFIPGFEDGLIGMEPGAEKDITVTFPTPYQSKELEGKEAVFHVKVNGIQVKELPALDDEFAQDVSEFNTLAELRNAKRAEIDEQFAKQATTEKENQAIKLVVENAELEVPEAMVERQVDYMLQDMAYRLSMQGLRMEDYCKYTGNTIEGLREQMHDDAESRVKSQVVLGEIKKAENIAATAEEIDAKLAEYATQMGKSLEDMKKDLKPDDTQYFADQIELDKTLAVIMDNAKAVKAKKAEKKAAKKDAEAADAPETKKPAAKKKAKAEADAAE